MYVETVNNAFCSLSRYFGWSYNEMEEMTPHQLASAGEAFSDKEAESGTVGADGNLHFSTLQELNFWRRGMGL